MTDSKKDVLEQTRLLGDSVAAAVPMRPNMGVSTSMRATLNTAVPAMMMAASCGAVAASASSTVAKPYSIARGCGAPGTRTVGQPPRNCATA